MESGQRRRHDLRGVVKLYFESYHVARWNIVIFGAGHVANALVTMLIHLDCRITLFDPRQEWIDKLPRSPRLTRSWLPTCRRW